MPRNGSGVYSLPSGYEATTGQTALASQHNPPLEDLRDDANAARPIVAGGTGATSAADARTNLGLVIGTNVQAYDATLTSIAALGTAANKGLYATGVDTWAEFDLTAAGRALLDDADAAAQRTTLGLGGAATKGFSDDETLTDAAADEAVSERAAKLYADAVGDGVAVSLISETDLSGVATHDIALDTSSYVAFKVYLAHMIPASGTDSLVGLFSTDGGSTYDTGASDYDWVLKRILGTTDSNSRSTDSEMVIATVVGSGTTQDGVSGELSIIAPNMARETVMRFQGTLTAGDGTFQIVESAGRHNSQAAVDYLRLKFSGGNIESGKVLVYGVKGA